MFGGTSYYSQERVCWFVQSEDNNDYKLYLAWVAAGNEALPYQDYLDSL